jgi:hypothetical protein
MLAKFKEHPVTTALGLLAAVCMWLATQPLDGPLTKQKVLQVLSAGFVALLGAFSADAKGGQ